MKLTQFTLTENILHETFVGDKGRFKSTTISVVVDDVQGKTRQEISDFAREQLNGLKSMTIANIKEQYVEPEAPKLPRKNPFSKGE